MRSSSFTAAVMFTALSGAAFAQSPPPATSVPAPPPTVTAPAAVPGAPVSALTDRDANFISAQLENNMAEVAAAQLALQRSQDTNVRNLAEKMINDHNYAQNTLQPIASIHHIAPPPTPTDAHRATLDRLSQLSGTAFDRAYVNFVVSDHAQDVSEFNDELPVVVDAQISAWTQNVRPMLLQHEEIAQQLLTSMKNSG
jgi:putative membrane protein